MKKITFLLAVLCSVVLCGAELPDFSKASSWQKSQWSKSEYSRSEAGVLTIVRTEPGSGAWCTVPFAVTPGEKFTGTVEAFYVEAQKKGSVRVGFNFLDAKNRRVKWQDVSAIYAPNGDFATKKISAVVPEGAVKLAIYVCLDGAGKAEFRNLKLSK